MFLASILFIVGLIGLISGARFLVMGAARLAKIFGISSLIVGLIVVGFGASAPELAVTLVGAWKGEGGLIVGNIVGSNIFNLLLVLGVGACITPLVIHKQLIWWDVPIMIFTTLLFWWFTANQTISRLEGGILFSGIVIYLIFACLTLKQNPSTEERSGYNDSILLQLFWILLGLIFLSFGSELLITNATKIARALGMSQLFIGLTIVSVGTSLPELATTIVALKKAEIDIAVGHIIGSNIFNLLAVMGITVLISPTPIEIPSQAFWFDIPIMIGVSIAALPIFLSGHKISRWEGALFLFYYLLYLLFLLLKDSFSSYLHYLTTACLFFILPLTILTLAVGVARHFKTR